MRQPRSPCWDKILAELEAQGEKLGWGELTVLIKYQAKKPRAMRVLKREETYLFDDTPLATNR